MLFRIYFVAFAIFVTGVLHAQDNAWMEDYSFNKVDSKVDAAIDSTVTVRPSAPAPPDPPSYMRDYYWDKAQKDTVVNSLGIAYVSSFIGGIIYASALTGLPYQYTAGFVVYDILTLPAVTGDVYNPLNIYMGLSLGNIIAGQIGFGGTVFSPESAVNIGAYFKGGMYLNSFDPYEGEQPANSLIGGFGMYVHGDLNVGVTIFSSFELIADPANLVILPGFTIGLGARLPT